MIPARLGSRSPEMAHLKVGKIWEKSGNPFFIQWVPMGPHGSPIFKQAPYLAWGFGDYDSYDPQKRGQSCERPSCVPTSPWSVVQGIPNSLRAEQTWRAHAKG